MSSGAGARSSNGSAPDAAERMRLEVDRLDLELKPLPLLAGRLVVAGVRLVRPVLHLEPATAGRLELPQPVPLGGRQVVFEAERHVQDLLRGRADRAQSVLEGSVRRLVRPAVLGHGHAVELDLEVAQRVVDDRPVRVRDDPEAEPRLLCSA